MAAQLSYYLAVSLDGFLAREDGAVDWLEPFGVNFSSPYDYDAYYRTVSAVVMGRKTFEVIEGMTPFPYEGRPAYVVTTGDSRRAGPVEFVHSPGPDWFRALKARHEERVWLVGGGQLAAYALAQGLLDEVILTIVPVTLGTGIPWMGKHERDRSWDLAGHFVSPGGIVQIAYRPHASI